MKRYAMNVTFEYGLDPQESPDGGWVRAKDVEALETELDRCIDELQKLVSEADRKGPDDNRHRLRGKIEGVNLALGKLRGH